MAQKLLARWCWPCTAAGLALVLVSATALASDGTGSALGFTARDVITGLLGLVLAMLGAFTAGFRSRLDTLEKRLESQATAMQQHREEVLKEYHTKEEIMRLLSTVNSGMEALHRRFDALNVPQVPRS